MDITQFIAMSLAQVQIRLLASCDGLTQPQVVWRPTPHSNNIGFILWHVARVEDSRISSFQGSGPDLWEAQAWYERFDQPVDAPDPGDRVGLRALAVPPLDTLVGYLKAAHQQTERFLTALPAARLDAVPDSPRPGVTIAGSLRHLITHKNNHHGQVDFLRGLQDEAWDLPPGTGMVLPPPATRG